MKDKILRYDTLYEDVYEYETVYDPHTFESFQKKVKTKTIEMLVPVFVDDDIINTNQSSNNYKYLLLK